MSAVLTLDKNKTITIETDNISIDLELSDDGGIIITKTGDYNDFIIKPVVANVIKIK